MHHAILKLDRAAGDFLQNITNGYYQPVYEAGLEEQLAIERISQSAMQRNRQIARNFAATYETVIQELNYLNFLDQHYPHLTTAEKEAFAERKRELVAIMRQSTAQANASLYRQ